MYIPKKTFKQTVCPVCKGQKYVKVTGKDEKILCPRCGGKGYI